MQLSKRPASTAWILCAKGAVVIQSASSNSVTEDELSECHKKAIQTNKRHRKKKASYWKHFTCLFPVLLMDMHLKQTETFTCKSKARS